MLKFGLQTKGEIMIWILIAWSLFNSWVSHKLYTLWFQARSPSIKDRREYAMGRRFGEGFEDIRRGEFPRYPPMDSVDVGEEDAHIFYLLGANYHLGGAEQRSAAYNTRPMRYPGVITGRFSLKKPNKTNGPST